jgi:hypothetical protein
MPHIKAAEDGSTLPGLYGEVEAIFRAEGIILTGIKDKSQEGGMVDQGIINHRAQFSIKKEKREGETSPFYRGEEKKVGTRNRMGPGKFLKG